MKRIFENRNFKLNLNDATLHLKNDNGAVYDVFILYQTKQAKELKLSEKDALTNDLNNLAIYMPKEARLKVNEAYDAYMSELKKVKV